MTTEMRKTGVDVVGDMPWGTHFCLFYETKADLLDTTVSYCKAGLESQEFCLWVVAEPLVVEDARHALKQAVPDFDRYFADQSIEIVAARDWYLQDGTFDLNRVIGGWNEKLARASARGYVGVRVTGDTAWLEKKDWKDFCEYEDSVNQAVANQRLAVLCTYPLAACGAAEILDVVRTHQFAVTKRRGDWDVIETAGHKQAKAEIKRLNEELEQRVVERTSQLTSVNRELTKEILQRQRAEEALLRSEAYLAEAQRVSHTGSFGWSVSSGHIVWSDETFRILECDPANKPTVEVILQRTHPEDRAFVQETLDQAVGDKKAFDFEHRLLVPDGSVKYVRIVGHPSTNYESGSFEFVGAVTDITESKLAEALREGESRILEMIARDAPLEEILEKLVLVVEAQFAGLLCSVLLLDEDGRHARHGAAPSLPKPYSDAIDGMCIGPKAGSCGTAMYRREPVVVTDILQDPLWELYRGTAEPYGLRACWSTPILAHSGKALGSFAMYCREPRSPNPSETHALEMATHLAGIAIERKLAREERERLREAQADLAHINRVTTMGELTASLAHEIKQPISAAITDARTCVRWLTRDDPDIAEARETAARIVKDVMHAADIINSISLLFKKGTLQRELVDVNELIREMIVLLRNEAARYSISIRSDLAEDIPRVMADRIQLQQVFMNLMLNAIDAMKDLSTARELTIRSHRVKDGQLMISVSDTGIGLPQQQAEQIFSAFFTTKAHGTGMGLPISRSIIESHGGRLWATSNSERGASFHFSLPNEAESRRTSAQDGVHPLSA
ncbi:MAG TPA: MEDS domain-containing protein [Terriglobales bacterium]|jgi:C4-dicarboxylate-specific signal transduction histidine kinase|nr:MEDS domain-containing protein [Terriglobales bacterium]